MTRTWSVETGVGQVSACLDGPAGAGKGCAVILAHGAGGHMTDGGMAAVTSQLGKHGFTVVRFNFRYREKGSRRPDPMPVLQECMAAVVDSARKRVHPRRWIIGGRSMGGRAASMLAADGFACDGVLLLAYPLHPAAAVDKIRDAHLARIGAPVLCLNGTRDALCRRDLMDAVVARLGDNFTMHWIEDADHAFRVRKASGRSEAGVLDEIGAAVDAWYTARVKAAR
ncbi:MAG: alpha/beta family hydrolase [Rudaea sp.]